MLNAWLTSARLHDGDEPGYRLLGARSATLAVCATYPPLVDWHGRTCRCRQQSCGAQRRTFPTTPSERGGALAVRVRDRAPSLLGAYEKSALQRRRQSVWRMLAQDDCYGIVRSFHRIGHKHTHTRKATARVGSRLRLRGEDPGSEVMLPFPTRNGVQTHAVVRRPSGAGDPIDECRRLHVWILFTNSNGPTGADEAGGG